MKIEAIFKTVQTDGLNPNVVLNNAAITGVANGDGQIIPDFANTSVRWEKTMRVNLTGAFADRRQMDRDIVEIPAGRLTWHPCMR